MPSPGPHPQLRFHPAEGAGPARFDVSGARVYMIGIGGSGMSGLARMLLSRGAVVSGSDREAGDATVVLEAAGVRVGFDQSAQALPGGLDLVVASAAIRPDHPQYAEAVRRGVPVLLYAETLGRCMLGRTGISVAGTHGKSTTTAMLGCVLTDCGLDPTVIVGATSRQLAGGCLAELSDEAAGFRLGGEKIPAGDKAGAPGILVAESCEYNRSFHNLRPTIASISSVEADHLDIFGTLDAVVEAFREFALLLPPASEGGFLLIAHEGAHRREIAAGLSCEVQTIGYSPEADWVVSFDPDTRRVTLRRAARLPIAGGEVLTRRQSFQPWLEAGAFDIVQPDVTKCGGISEERRIAQMAESHGIRFIPHGWNTASAWPPTCSWLPRSPARASSSTSRAPPLSTHSRRRRGAWIPRDSCRSHPAPASASNSMPPLSPN